MICYSELHREGLLFEGYLLLKFEELNGCLVTNGCNYMVFEVISCVVHAILSGVG